MNQEKEPMRAPRKVSFKTDEGEQTVCECSGSIRELLACAANAVAAEKLIKLSKKKKEGPLPLSKEGLQEKETINTIEVEIISRAVACSTQGLEEMAERMPETCNDHIGRLF